MGIRENFIELPHKLVPFSDKVDTTFQYETIDYTIGKIQYNKASDALTTSLSWRLDEKDYIADGIVIRAGINIVQQYNTRLPSLVAVNKNSSGAITDISELELYIIIEFDKYFRGL